MVEPESEQQPEREAAVHIWSATGAGEAIRALAWSPDGTMVAAATFLPHVDIYDAKPLVSRTQVNKEGSMTGI